MPRTRTVNPITKDKTTWQEVDGLLSGIAWADNTVSFSFPQLARDYGQYSSETNTFRSFLPNEQVYFDSVFDNISAVTNLSFFEATGNPGDATIRLGKADLKGAEGWAYYPSTDAKGGDAWFDWSTL